MSRWCGDQGHRSMRQMTFLFFIISLSWSLAFVFRIPGEGNFWFCSLIYKARNWELTQWMGRAQPLQPSPLPPKVCVSRALESGAELGLDSRTLMGQGHPSPVLMPKIYAHPLGNFERLWMINLLIFTKLKDQIWSSCSHRGPRIRRSTTSLKWAGP